MSKKASRVLPMEYFEYLLNHECRYAERYTQCFAVVSIEVQPFKPHQSKFKPFSRLIRGLTRHTDIVGFFHDQDIAVILHHTFEEDIQKVVRRLHTTIKRFFNNTSPCPAISIGAACFPIHATTLQGLREMVQKNKVPH